MAANEERAKKRRKGAVPERVNTPVAKQQIRKAQRNSVSEGAGAEAEKQQAEKISQTKMCVNCPSKQAREHLWPDEQRDDSVYWCEACWAVFNKEQRENARSKGARPLVDDRINTPEGMPLVSRRRRGAGWIVAGGRRRARCWAAHQ